MNPTEALQLGIILAQQKMLDLIYEELRKRGIELMPLMVGTSGWSYKEWEKIFYPDSKTPKLSYYSKIFKTAEIDSTFYANPKRGLVFGWAKNTPKNFQFSVKLPQLITHKKKLDLAQGSGNRPERLYRAAPTAE